MFAQLQYLYWVITFQCLCRLHLDFALISKRPSDVLIWTECWR